MLNEPVYIPILQEYANRPNFVGVKSIVSSPVAGRILLIFKEGIVKALAQLKMLLVTIFRCTGIPALSVVTSDL